jgi:hypothetical protein
MSDQINRIKELMNLKIITEGIEPQVARGFRDFFEHIISNPSLGNMQRAEVDNIINNTTRKEIKNLSATEVETLMKNIDYESLVRTLLNKGLLSTQARRNFFRNYINAISQNRMTVQQTINAVENNKYFTTLYNSSRNMPANEPVPQFVTKMEQEFNKVLREEYENELRQSGIQVPPRTSSPQIDDLVSMMKDRTKIYDYVEGEVKTLKSGVGRKIPRQQIEKFTDDLMKIVNESVKKLNPEFELLFKDFDKVFSKMDDKTKAEYLQRAFNEFSSKISSDVKISKTFSKKILDNIVNYFKGGAGIKDMINEYKSGKKLWHEILKPRYAYALSASAIGTIAQILRGQNPVSEWGGLSEWGWKKYFLTLTPGINTAFSTIYAIWEFLALGAEKVILPAFKGDNYEGKGGDYSSTISIDEAKDFVMNQDGLNNLIPSGVNSSELTYKGTEKGKAIDVYYQDNYICSLIKDCKSVDVGRVKDFGACKIKIR